ncbi:MAG: glycogen-binding domain-containing protein [Gemmatimonadota bacterium]
MARTRKNPAPVKAPVKKSVAFTLRAPGAKSVFLAGSFNHWDATGCPMKQSGKGLWTSQVPLEPGTYEYRFVVDGEWQDDPACPEHRTNAFGVNNCVVCV